MSWTDERVETLKRMWADGQSASQIARELGGVTRNAVIGKVHRLGLSNRVLGADAAGDAAAETVPDAAPDSAADPAADTTAEAGAAADAPAATDSAAAAAADAQTAIAAAGAQQDGAAMAEPATATDEAPDHDDAQGATAVVTRRPLITAGQPLPPQPSANEISAEALATVREVEKRARKLTLMELTERTCKWPVGDPATPDFWFCGLPAQTGKPYCEAHVGVAFQPMSARRDRRR